MRDAQIPQVTSLMLAIVQAEDADALIGALTEKGLRVTRIDTRGGFLQQDNVVVVVGTDADGETQVAEAIRETCRTRTTYFFGGAAGDPGASMMWPVEVQIGGAVVFVLPVDWHVHLNDEAIALAGIESLLGVR
jgi:uncharacterized protein YaaQ